MNKIIVVEDVLENGISVCEQFRAKAKGDPSLNIYVECLCYFNADMKQAAHEIERYKDLEYKIVPVSLWNFEEVLNSYYDEGNSVIIMDFLLGGDGSDGIAERRVNIRYASERLGKKRIWFYTVSGYDTKEKLKKLVSPYVLEVLDTTSTSIELDLDNKEFQNVLRRE